MQIISNFFVAEFILISLLWLGESEQNMIVSGCLSLKKGEKIILKT